MSSRLRALIKNVRACKTAAEERAAIARECAAIRTDIKNEESEYRHRNVAKLLYIHMMGYPTHFGQMECLKLIVSPNFADKRIGYLGLMLLLDERQEVLMLVTNSLKNDLNHPNQYVVGLALCALANISSESIARDLTGDIVKLLGSFNPYIRKKAALCAIRIVRKVPELMENFLPKIRTLLTERNHGVLITSVSLITVLCELDENNIRQFRRLVPSLVRILKNLVLSGYAPEHDVGGVTDPFLQVKILRLFRILGHKSEAASDHMNDILAQVATNTEGIRNVGNAILYECVQTIMGIESESGLRVLAINILGRFLLNRDNNIRYVALNTLAQVVHADVQAVQRHRGTIVDCLKDDDISIRRRALVLVYSLVNESNVRILVRELLTFLITQDPEFRADLTARICLVTEKYAPSKKWHVDTILRVMTIAGDFVSDEVISNLIAVITQTPELQSYAVQKMYIALNKDIMKQPLVQLGAWCIGEFGDILITKPAPSSSEEGEGMDAVVTASDTLNLFDKILHHPSTTNTTRQVVLTALSKLSERFSSDSSLVQQVQEMIDEFTTNMDVELQQRSCEYHNVLLRLSSPQRAALLERMPALEDVRGALKEKDELDQEPIVAPEDTAMAASSSAAAAADSLLLNLMDEPTTSAGSTPSPAAPANLLAELAGPTTSPAPAAASLLDLLGDGPVNNTPTSPPASSQSPILSAGAGPQSPPVSSPPLSGGGGPLTPAGGALPSMIAYQKNGVAIKFDIVKSPTDPKKTLITASTLNANAGPMTNYNFKAAVPKYVSLALKPPSGTVVPANKQGIITQQMLVDNSMHGQKSVLMKLRLEYDLAGQHVVDTADCPSFPSGV